jgi:hypothetical protein
MPEVLAAFRGPVSCHRPPAPLALILCGVSTAGEPTTLAFSDPSSDELPATLEDPRIECLGAGDYRLTSRGGAWRVAARAVHLHAEVGAAFYRAVPPRAVPWPKRLFWRAVLALAAHRVGLAALRMLRR